MAEFMGSTKLVYMYQFFFAKQIAERRMHYHCGDETRAVMHGLITLEAKLPIQLLCSVTGNCNKQHAFQEGTQSKPRLYETRFCETQFNKRIDSPSDSNRNQYIYELEKKRQFTVTSDLTKDLRKPKKKKSANAFSVRRREFKVVTTCCSWRAPDAHVTPLRCTRAVLALTIRRTWTHAPLARSTLRTTCFVLALLGGAQGEALCVRRAREERMNTVWARITAFFVRI